MMIKCPECGNEVSEYSTQCPSCGCPSSIYFSNENIYFDTLLLKSDRE